MLIHPGFVEGIGYFLSYTQQMHPCSLPYVNASCCVNERCAYLKLMIGLAKHSDLH